MIPVHMIRVVVGEDTIQVPVFMLPFAGGQDGFAPPGGFFVGKEGEYGVIVDGRIPLEQVPRLATEEVRKNLPNLQRLVRDQFEALRREQPGHTT